MLHDVQEWEIETDKRFGKPLMFPKQQLIQFNQLSCITYNLLTQLVPA